MNTPVLTAVYTVTIDEELAFGTVITNTAYFSASAEAGWTNEVATTIDCVEVELVKMSLASPAPVYIGNAADMSADISPASTTKPYNYRITVDGTPGTPQASGDDPLAFSQTFGTTGTHMVEIAVWNCGMNEMQAVTDTLPVEVSPYYLYLPTVMKQYKP